MDVKKDLNSHRPSRSIDGFVLPNHVRQPAAEHKNTEQFESNTPKEATQTYKSAPFDLSLPGDVQSSPSGKSRRWFFRRKRRPGKDKNKFADHTVRQRIIKWILIILLMTAVGIGGYFGWRILVNASKVFRGNILGAVTSIISPDKPLKTDSYGNTNVLVLGTSESDPNHPGAQLTDSMMIISFNKAQKTAFLFSIPRDLWVQYAAPCSAGYSGKINAAYECALNNADGSNNGDETKAENTVAGTVGSVFGVNIQYVAHLNLAVVQKVVDAVGGIDITIASPDPRGILDRNFDWRCKYTCYLVKYANGPAHLDGTHAMWLAQARNDSGGYGLPRGNFDREDNQRKMLIAIEKKALTIGFLANPVNITNLLDALGSNVHTTIDASEIKSFIDIGKSIPTDSITSVDIIQSAPTILTTGTGPDGSSIVRPTAGLYDYAALQAFSASMLKGQGPLIEEAAKVDVLNGSGVTGAATQEATNLTQAGFMIGTVDSAPASYSNTAQYTLYDLSKGSKPATLTALKKSLGVTTTQTTLPAGVTTTSPFVVIVGKPASTTTTNSGN